METCVLTWKTAHQFGPLWYQHHCLRKSLFVDQMGWEIPHSDRAEWDQYDTDRTTYIITHEGGTALAASRLNPCDHQSGGWSYMIRDAALGKLGGIPGNLITSPPTAPDILEATRFTVDPKLSDELRNAALAQNAQTLQEAAISMGARQLIALMSPAFIRWLRGVGLNAERIGPNVRTGDGGRACVIGVNLHAHCDA